DPGERAPGGPGRERSDRRAAVRPTGRGRRVAELLQSLHLRSAGLQRGASPGRALLLRHRGRPRVRLAVAYSGPSPRGLRARVGGGGPGAPGRHPSPHRPGQPHRGRRPGHGAGRARPRSRGGDGRHQAAARPGHRRPEARRRHPVFPGDVRLRRAARRGGRPEPPPPPLPPGVRPNQPRDGPIRLGGHRGRRGREPGAGDDRDRRVPARRRAQQHRGRRAMTTLAAGRMAGRLTVPFARGADVLSLTLRPGTSIQASVAAYDFADHAARFNRLPDPRYVVAALQDVVTPVRLTIAYEVLNRGASATPGAATLEVPAGTLAGSSLALDLGADEGPRTRLRSIAVAPPVPAGVVGDWWQLTALLGNLAKLLWAVGWERDHIRRQLVRVKTQRRLADSIGLSLDLVGFELGIPRFPPLPYAFDPDILALYHLDDVAGATPAAADMMARYGGAGHPGANVGGRAQAGAPGRFGTGFAFRDPTAEIRIPDHAEIALTAASTLTVQCFLKPDPGAGD